MLINIPKEDMEKLLEDIHKIAKGLTVFKDKSVFIYNNDELYINFKAIDKVLPIIVTAEEEAWNIIKTWKTKLGGY